MHRSEKHFKNPEVFDPNNFLPEKVAERHMYSFLPFSGGPRNCIGKFTINSVCILGQHLHFMFFPGMRYANSVLKLITIYVVKNFTLTTSLKYEDLKFRMNITLNLLNTHLVTITRRPSSE